MQRHKMQVLACAREGGEDNTKLQQTRIIAIYLWPCLHFDMFLSWGAHSPAAISTCLCCTSSQLQA